MFFRWFSFISDKNEKRGEEEGSEGQKEAATMTRHRKTGRMDGESGSLRAKRGLDYGAAYQDRAVEQIQASATMRSFCLAMNP